uniref:sulfotransferase family 2 domain-containing protein n=1 Tax=Ningiella ruwaisensis TaxID=2364274 RepID=UPI0010A0B567|nr:sulfotransferase family 2 domain-containing protein [Ningiella ruwaisensis]
MISHKYQCIFIHIPKCAGTSIESAFEHFDASHSRGRQDHRSVRMIQKPFPIFKAFSSSDNLKDTIRRFREYTRTQSNPNNALTVSKAQYKNYFKFTIVRNPWDRAFSWYKNAMRDEIHQKNYQIPAGIDFETFIEQFAGTGYLRPQTYWLKNYSGAIDMDFIGKFESLNQDFITICERLNVSDKKLPHEIKSSENEAPKKSISLKAKAFIDNYYQEEIALFNYRFEEHCSLVCR